MTGASYVHSGAMHLYVRLMIRLLLPDVVVQVEYVQVYDARCLELDILFCINMIFFRIKYRKPSSATWSWLHKITHCMCLSEKEFGGLVFVLPISTSTGILVDYREYQQVAVILLQWTT